MFGVSVYHFSSYHQIDYVKISCVYHSASVLHCESYGVSVLRMIKLALNSYVFLLFFFFMFEHCKKERANENRIEILVDSVGIDGKIRSWAQGEEF